MESKYLTAKEVAAQLRISLPTVYALHKDGRLGGFHVNNKTIRFTQEQVDAYMESVKKTRVQPPTASER